MKYVMTEFRGKRAGWFRPKPVRKVGPSCPRCGSNSHIGTTTCVILVEPRKTAGTVD